MSASASANRLHVLTLTPFYPVEGDDGQGCFVAEPIAWLERFGFSNTTIAAQPFYRSRMKPEQNFPAEWRRFFSFPGNLGLASAGAFLFANLLPRVKELHRANPIRLIHAHAALPCGHAAALLSRELGIPFVVTVHGLDAYSTNQVGGLPGQWCKRVSLMAYRSARCVICISEKVREQVLRGGSNLRTEVVYNGVDERRFAPADAANDPAVILTVGNLIPIKGHEWLMRSLAPIPQQNWRWDVIGSGPELPRLTSLATDLGIGDRVRFLGRRSREQVVQAMQSSTLFALPSRYEGLGCVYLEAMSSGKAVIACRGQGIDEVITHGADGWLVDPSDQDALVTALTALLRDPRLRQKMGAAARQKILENYTLAHQTAQLAGIYEEGVR